MKGKNKLKILIIVVVMALCSGFVYKGKISPKLYDKYLNEGINYLNEGNYKEAILAFNKGIKKDKKSIEIRMYQAKAFIGNKEVDKAITVLEEAQNIDKTNEELVKEIIEILKNVDSETAYEFLNRYVKEVGEHNISQEIKEMFESANQVPSKPIVKPEPGKYIKPLSIKLESDNVKLGHVYYYTLNGTHPNKGSDKYKGQIEIKQSSTVKLIGYNKKDEHTDVISFEYIIDETILKEIEKSIEEAEKLIENTQEGNGAGNCIKGSKEKLISSINSTKKSISKDRLAYSDGKKIKDSIDKSIEDFKNNIIKQTDKIELEQAISSAQQLYDNAVEGTNAGQYEIGSKSYLADIIEVANELNNNLLAKQYEIDNMVKQINNAIKVFENKKVESIPSNLKQAYLNRIKSEEIKAQNRRDNFTCFADLRGADWDESEAYQQILNEIYVDLNKYLPSSKKQEVNLDKVKFEQEKNDYLKQCEDSYQAAVEETGSQSPFGNSWDGGQYEVGQIAKKYALTLINKYM